VDDVGSKKDNPHEVIRLQTTSGNIAKTRGFAFMIAKPKKLSVMKYRVFYIVMSQVEEHHTAETVYEIDVAALAEHLGIEKHKLMENMRKVTKEMIGTVLEWYDEKGNLKQAGLLAESEHVPNEYIIKVMVAKSFIAQLAQMKKAYDLNYPMGGPLCFDNVASFVFFDMCLICIKEYNGVREYNVDEMRADLTIEPEKYVGNNPGLNAKVIVKAVEDMNKYTNLDVECNPRYEGRKIIGWVLYSCYKDGQRPVEPMPFMQTLLGFDEQAPNIEELRRTLVNGYNVSWYVFNKFVRDYGLKAADRMWRNMNYVLKMKKVSNFPRYFYSAVIGDFDMQDRLVQGELEGKKKAAAIASAKLQKQMEDEIKHFDEELPVLSNEEVQEFLNKMRTEVAATKQLNESEMQVTATVSTILSPEEIYAMIESLSEGPHKQRLEERYADIINRFKPKEGFQP
jgi:hypothetical protein